jgi:purine-nucleoside phosphorylase
MDHLAGELEAAVAGHDARGWPRPAVALVSGSGLSVDLALPSLGRLPLRALVPWKIEAIAGHPLEVELLVPEGGLPILYFRGRIHSYQGYTAAQTVFPVRLAALLGARTLLLTNAAGALDASLTPGTLVAITDHLNLTGLNPLLGEPPAAWGPRFPDLSEAYDPELRRLLHAEAAGLGLGLREGVYAGVAGPSYETPAEVRMLHLMGAHVVGMSTVLEVIAARHLGVRCAALAVASNLAAGLVSSPLTHREVLEVGRRAALTVATLLSRLLLRPGLAMPEGRTAGALDRASP